MFNENVLRMRFLASLEMTMFALGEGGQQGRRSRRPCCPPLISYCVSFRMERSEMRNLTQ